VPLLDSNDFPAIRKAIDLGLTEAGLPTPVIEQDIYLQASVDWVTRGAKVELGEGEDFPDVLDSEELVHAKRAAIYYCASLLAPVCNIPTSDAAGGLGSYTRKVMEPGANSRRLLELAQGELAFLIKDEEAVSVAPFSGSVTTRAVW